MVRAAPTIHDNAADQAEAEPDAVQRQDGSWLLAGWKPADDMAELLKLALPQQGAQRPWWRCQAARGWGSPLR